MECVYLPSHPTFSSQHCKRSSALLCHCSTRTVDSPSLHGLESFRNMLHHRHTATFLSFAFIPPHHFCHFFGTLNNQFEQYLFGIKFNSRSLVYSVFACNALCLRALSVCVCKSLYFIGCAGLHSLNQRHGFLSPLRNQMEKLPSRNISTNALMFDHFAQRKFPVGFGCPNVNGTQTKQCHRTCRKQRI